MKSDPDEGREMKPLEELQQLLREDGTCVTDAQAEAIAIRVSQSVEAYLARRRRQRQMAIAEAPRRVGRALA
jgi:hypothetical protein